MKRAVVLILLLCIVCANAQVSPGNHDYEFSNGNWFNGQKFVNRTFYSVGGLLTSKRPPHVEGVFDLSGD